MDDKTVLPSLPLDGHPRTHHGNEYEAKVKLTVEGIGQSGTLEKTAFIDRVKTYILTHVHTETVLNEVAAYLAIDERLSDEQQTWITQEIEKHRHELEQRQEQRHVLRRTSTEEKLSTLYQLSLKHESSIDEEPSGSGSSSPDMEWEQ